MDFSLFIIVGGIVLILYMIKLLTGSSQEGKQKYSKNKDREQTFYQRNTPRKVHTYTDYDKFFKENFARDYEETSNLYHKYDKLHQSVWGEDPVHQLGIPSTTQTGTSVKSNAERILGDYFTKNNIMYKYENVVENKDKKRIHPDFYLPDYDVYVEYWGLVNILDERMKEKYVKEMKWKMAQYHSQGIKFVSIYPFDMKYLDYAFPRKFEKVTGRKFAN